MKRKLTGRSKVQTDKTDITAQNVVSVLQKAITDFEINKVDIQYLYNYYRGDQDILRRQKKVRPEICNTVVENRANQIVSFKVGYLVGEPIQYILRSKEVADELRRFNDFVFEQDKSSKDTELANWMHICGVGVRMIYPNDEYSEDSDESPFEIFTLDPRQAFVVYDTGLGEKPVMGVYHVTVDDKEVYYCYTENELFVVQENELVQCEDNPLGQVPIIEYPLNHARIGSFELVLGLLNALNLLDSNRMDGIEQFIQALLIFQNVDITAEDVQALIDLGAIKMRDIDPQTRGDIRYITKELNQTQTQTLKEDILQSVIEICNLPNRNGGTSTSDTGSAVVMRDGWSSAENSAKDTEAIFRRSEKQSIKLMLNICKKVDYKHFKDLQIKDIEIRFTRRNYENILAKSQVLIALLNNDKVHPLTAYTVCNMFADPYVPYEQGMEWYEKYSELNKEPKPPENEGVDKLNGDTGQNSNPTDRTSREDSIGKKRE